MEYAERLRYVREGVRDVKLAQKVATLSKIPELEEFSPSVLEQLARISVSHEPSPVQQTIDEQGEPTGQSQFKKPYGVRCEHSAKLFGVLPTRYKPFAHYLV